jgi:hypothetical protein
MESNNVINGDTEYTPRLVSRGVPIIKGPPVVDKLVLISFGTKWIKTNENYRKNEHATHVPANCYAIQTGIYCSL